MRREVYVLVINRPDDVTVAQMKTYLKEAVEHWCSGEGINHTPDSLYGWFSKFGNAVHVARRNLKHEESSSDDRSHARHKK